MKVLHQKISSSFHIKSHGEVFLSIDSNGDGVAFYGRIEEFDYNEIKESLKKIKIDIELCHEVKLITNLENKNKLEPILDKFKKLKYIERQLGFEFYFMPQGHIVRVAKEEVKASPIQKKSKVRVLIIDDSKTICRFLEKIMAQDDRLEVIGMINDPLKAEEFIIQHKPDVITLDIHMPNMNGVELIKRIHPKFHIPTIMISSISIQEGPLVMEALESGAVDYIQKPEISNIDIVANEINEKIRLASLVQQSAQLQSSKKLASLSKFKNIEDKLIVIGSSTGGTRALREILIKLPAEIPPILIVQHIPEVFSKAFAERLNQQCPFEIKEAAHGDIIKPNQVLIAQGGKQMKIKKVNQNYQVEVNMDAPVNRFRPSVDYLFKSTAEVVDDKNILAIILTGMGNDGALGMQSLKEKRNALTIAQDEKSSVVFGMPKEAIKLGCVDQVLDLDEISTHMISIFN